MERAGLNDAGRSRLHFELAIALTFVQRALLPWLTFITKAPLPPLSSENLPCLRFNPGRIPASSLFQKRTPTLILSAVQSTGDRYNPQHGANER